MLSLLTGLVMDLAQNFNKNSDLRNALMNPQIERLLNTLNSYSDPESQQSASAAF